MHYYQFNIGDYASHTRYLTPMQDLVYRRLLDLYYLQEKPISLENPAMQIGLNDCLTDVERVLNDYFIRTEKGWINKRVDAEIQSYKGKKKQASEAGKKSGEVRRANKDAPIEQVLNERLTTVEPTINQEPLTINQEPLNNNHKPLKKDNANKLADSAFDEFWQVYPNKTAKQKAIDSWAKIKNKEQVLEQIIDALKWQTYMPKWCEENGKYIPHPATYLNQQRWLDEQPMPTKVIAYETPYQKSMRERVEEISPNIARKVSRPINFNFVEDIQDVITDQSN